MRRQCCTLNPFFLPLPPLHKHKESQENDGQTGSRSLDKAVLAHDARYQKNVCHQKPAHTSPSAQLLQRGTRTQSAGKFQQVLEVLTAHRGIRSCGIEPFLTLRRILHNCTCLPFGAGFEAGLASGFGMGLCFLFVGTKLSSTISVVK